MFRPRRSRTSLQQNTGGWRYRLNGKENVYAIGRYPDIGLKDARDLARAARQNVAHHVAPAEGQTQENRRAAT